MALRIVDVEAFVRRRLDGVPQSLSMVLLCNQAGQHLVSMHEWRWLTRTPFPMVLLSGAERLPLPLDFGYVIQAAEDGSSSAVQSRICFTDPGQIAFKRMANLTPSPPYVYWGSVVHVVVDGGRVVPMLDIYPTGSGETVDLYYRAGWKPLAEDDDLIPIPPWLESFYLAIVFAFAQGFEEHDLGSFEDRLGAVSASQMCAEMKARDGLMQAEMGPWRGGMAQRSRDGGYDWDLYPTSITLGS
jgi:hypothetical protein